MLRFYVDVCQKGRLVHEKGGVGYTRGVGNERNQNSEKIIYQILRGMDGEGEREEKRKSWRRGREKERKYREKVC